MPHRRPSRGVYALDIETDTSRGGLDPDSSAVLAVAFIDEGQSVVMTGSERSILGALDERIRLSEPGTIVTWNGSGFDLPFLADRADRLGIKIGLRLVLDPAIIQRRGPLPGHLGAYRARWYAHSHLDAYLAYRELLEGTGLSCGLKNVARRAGLETLEVDRSRIHALSRRQLCSYVQRDATLTRRLALDRWADVSPRVDRFAAAGPTHAPEPAVAEIRLARQR